MRRLLIFIICFFSISDIFCQERGFCCYTEVFEYKGNEYVIFPRPAHYPSENPDYPSSFYYFSRPPKKEEVIYVDSLAFEYVKKQKRLPNQGFPNCPIIKDNWNDYYRQAVCYLDEGYRRKREIIEIRYIRKEVALETERDFEQYMQSSWNWKENWDKTLGGCSAHFSIYYDVRKDKIVSFIVN